MYGRFRPHKRVFSDVSGPSMTRQEFAADADVNNIMARFERTGMMPNVNPSVPPVYLDLSNVPDFHAAMQLMIDAEQAFMTLPAAVRKSFDNDPAKFVDFAEKGENLAQMRAWGLAPPAEEPELVPAPEPPVAAPTPKA